MTGLEELEIELLVYLGKEIDDFLDAVDDYDGNELSDRTKGIIKLVKGVKNDIY